MRKRVTFINVALTLATVLILSVTCSAQTPSPVSLVARRDYSVGQQPLAAATADFNSDGKLDIVTLNQGSNDVSVLLGNGDGTFQPPVKYSIAVPGVFPFTLFIDDFNNDGKPDILVVSGFGSGSTPASVSVLLGNGDGTFQTQKVSNVSINNRCNSCVVVGDFDGDGKLDLAFAAAVPQLGNSAIELMRGNGDGTFQTATTMIPGPFPTPSQLQDADLNGDGKLDLVWTYTDPSTQVLTLSVHLSNGDGTFQSGKNITLGFASGPFVTADFTGDGKLDVALLESLGTNQVAVLPGNGDGTFQPPILSSIVCGLSSCPIIAGDVNDDGKVDLLVIGSGFQILLANGDGTFQTGLTVAIPSTLNSAAFADFNGDHKLDLAFVGFPNVDSPASGSGIVSVALGNGDGTFQLDTPLFATGAPCSGPCVSLTADFNGDGIPDLLLAGALEPQGVAVLLGNGNGTFQSPIDADADRQCPSVPGIFNCVAVIGDLNGNGKLDLAVTSSFGPVGILLGNGDGTFAPEVNYNGGGGSIALGSFRGNGHLDIVTTGVGSISPTTANESLLLLLGNGDGTFGFPTSINLNAIPFFVAVGDFNGDGKLDLAVAEGNNLAILLGKGDGSFGSETDFATPAGSNTLAVADLNGDGKLDIVTGNSTSNNVSVFLGNGDGTFLLSNTYPVITTVASVAVADLNSDSKPDLIVSNGFDVSVLLGNGDGTFQPAENFGTAQVVGPIAIADFNGDGSLDVATGLSLLFNRANGPAAVAPSQLDFENTDVGTTAAGAITLMSSGSQALNISSISITGPQSSDFSQTNSCPSSLASGVTCTLTVKFTPAAPGLRTASIQIANNAFNSPKIIALVGTGVAAPGTSLSPSVLSFGNQTINTTSASQAVTLTNKGDAALTVGSVAITGSESGEFIATNNCGSSLAAGANCIIGVSFAPAAQGARSAALSITDNALNSPQTVQLSGTGVATLGLGIGANGSSSATVAAGNTANYTLSVGGNGFSGTATLSCSGAPKGAACSAPPNENVSATTATTFAVSVSTTARTLAAAVPESRFSSSWLWAIAILGLVILPSSRGRKRPILRRGRALPLIVLLFFCSCGGGSSTSTGSTVNPNGTPAGNYTLTVTAISGVMSQSAQLTLTVQ